MIEKVKTEHTDYLFKAVLSLETIEECYKFFDDLCTVSEVTEMSKRLWVARMLNESMPYSEISALTGLSTATISRVNRSLKYGSDGYTTVIKRLNDAGVGDEK